MACDSIKLKDGKDLLAEKPEPSASMNTFQSFGKPVTQFYRQRNLLRLKTRKPRTLNPEWQ